MHIQLLQCRAEAEQAARAQADQQRAELQLAQKTNQDLAGQLAATEAKSGALLEQIRSVKGRLASETQRLEEARAQVCRYGRTCMCVYVGSSALDGMRQ